MHTFLESLIPAVHCVSSLDTPSRSCCARDVVVWMFVVRSADPTRKDSSAWAAASTLATRSSQLVRQHARKWGKYSSFGALPRHQPAVVGTYGCPHQMGNKMFPGLNALAIAVVADLPMIWLCSANCRRGCARFLDRKAWPNASDSVPTDRPTRGINTAWVGANWLAQVSSSFSLEPWLLACQPPNPSDSVVSYGPSGQQQQAAALALQGSSLTVEQQRHAAQLFALGADYAFGVLFRAAFSFRPFVAEATEEQLARTLGRGSPSGAYKYNHGWRQDPCAFWLAVHVRHQDEGDRGDRPGDVRAFGGAIRRAVLTANASSCVVLVATDREPTFELLRGLVVAQSCTFMRAALPASGIPERNPENKEHGERASEGAMRDVSAAYRTCLHHKWSPRIYLRLQDVFTISAQVHLLSFADAIIGTFGSSYSMLLTSLVAAGSVNSRDAKLRRCTAPIPWPTVTLCRTTSHSTREPRDRDSKPCTDPEPLLRPQGVPPAKLHAGIDVDCTGSSQRCVRPPATRRYAFNLGPACDCNGTWWGGCKRATTGDSLRTT